MAFAALFCFDFFLLSLLLASRSELSPSLSSPLRTVFLKSVDLGLRDTLDICFTVIADFVNGHNLWLQQRQQQLL